jgi:hypothetical protein
MTMVPAAIAATTNKRSFFTLIPPEISLALLKEYNGRTGQRYPKVPVTIGPVGT